jgi:hypothetical protein
MNYLKMNLKRFIWRLQDIWEDVVFRYIDGDVYLRRWIFINYLENHKPYYRKEDLYGLSNKQLLEAIKEVRLQEILEEDGYEAHTNTY